MQKKVGNTLLVLKQGDITQENVDAIVNAANSQLIPGNGVDGAIHRAGGKQLLEELQQYDGCSPGEVVVTTGGNLRAKYVFYTVGPVWKGGNSRESVILANCYKNCIFKAIEMDITSISFPAISTGAYGYPVGKAAKIALSLTIDVLKSASIKEVRFVLYTTSILKVFESVLKEEIVF